MNGEDARQIAGSLGRIEAKQEEHDRRFDSIEKRQLAGEADADGLRLAAAELRAAIESRPCERHAEKMRDQSRKISGLTKAVQKGETTGQIELARAEAESAARAKIQKETSRKWQVYAAIASVVSAAAGLGLFKLIGG